MYFNNIIVVFFCNSKYRPYDYSYSSRQHTSAGVGSSDASHRMPPMAQKKHHMFGKRCFQEQSSGKAHVLRCLAMKFI